MSKSKNNRVHYEKIWNNEKLLLFHVGNNNNSLKENGCLIWECGSSPVENKLEAVQFNNPPIN
jgi:hypothetical protein